MHYFPKYFLGETCFLRLPSHIACLPPETPLVPIVQRFLNYGGMVLNNSARSIKQLFVLTCGKQSNQSLFIENLRLYLKTNILMNEK